MGFLSGWVKSGRLEMTEPLAKAKLALARLATPQVALHSAAASPRELEKSEADSPEQLRVTPPVQRSDLRAPAFASPTRQLLIPSRAR
jgi:hypothetical protein